MKIMHIHTYPLLVVIGFTSIALGIDLKTHRIPNWLTVTAAVLGLVFHSVSGGTTGAGMSLGGFATGFGILLVLWLIGGGGGGDVKLMGAIGAWLGALPTLFIFIGSAVFAVLCVIALRLSRRRSRDSAKLTPRSSEQSQESSILKQTIPYALPVSLAIWTLVAVQVFNRFVG